MNRAGSFLYEPAGSVHTLDVHRGRHPGVVPHVRREPQPRRRRQRGVGRSTAPARCAAYYALCEAQGFERPNVIVALSHSTRPARDRREDGGADGRCRGGDPVAEEIESSALGDLLGVTESAIDTADPVSLGRSYVGAMRRAARRPWRSVPAWLRYGAGLGMTGTQLVTRAVGCAPCPRSCNRSPATPGSATPRGTTTSSSTAGCRCTSSPTRLLHELVEAAGLPSPEGPKAEFAAIAARRRAGTHQPAVHQPARTQARVRDRRHERGARRAQLRARSAAQRRLAAPGRPHRRSCSGSNTAATPGPRRVPQRPHRGAAVRRRPPTRCSSARCWWSRPGSTATTSPTSRRARAWWSGRSPTATRRSR